MQKFYVSCFLTMQQRFSACYWTATGSHSSGTNLSAASFIEICLISSYTSKCRMFREAQPLQNAHRKETFTTHYQQIATLWDIIRPHILKLSLANSQTCKKLFQLKKLFQFSSQYAAHKKTVHVTSVSGVGDGVMEPSDPFREPWRSVGMDTGRCHWVVPVGMCQ